MANYIYRGVTSAGLKESGLLEGDNEQQIREQLKTKGIFILSIKKENSFKQIFSDFKTNKKIKARDYSVFCRQFVSILNAGVSMLSALKMLGEQTESVALKEGILEAQIMVEKGESLTTAMKMQPKVFPAMLCNLVEAGEVSGSMEKSLKRMAEHFEKEAKLKSMIQKAMIYPIIVALVAVGVLSAMLLFVIPNFMNMFTQVNIEMPATTKFVIALSNFTLNYWYFILIAIGCIVLGFYFYQKSEKGQRVLGRLKMKVPILGKLTVKIACARFSRTLSTLLNAGIPMVQAITIVSNSMNNVLYTDALELAKEQITRGVPLSRPLKLSGIFPPMVIHMVGIGEETGNLEDMLTNVADYYDEEVERATEQLTAAMEPLIIVVMAVIVGFLILSIMQPLLTLYQNLDTI